MTIASAFEKTSELLLLAAFFLKKSCKLVCFIVYLYLLVTYHNTIVKIK